MHVSGYTLRPDHRLPKLRAQILELPSTREAENYRVLRAELDELLYVYGGGSLVWREVSLLLDAAFYMDAQRNFGLLQWIRGEYAKEGVENDFSSFWAELRSVMHPRTLSPHGYLQSLEGRDSSAIWRDIGILQDKVLALGYEVFINSGTLLGVVREGTFIAHDDDVDLAVILHSDTLEGVVREWCQLKSLLAKNWLLDADFERIGNAHCKIGRAGGASVDLFPAWFQGESFWVWPYLNGGVARDDVLPLDSRVFDGVTARLPRRPEVLLARNYGECWRIPDPSFRFDWKRAAREFDGFLTAHRQARTQA